MGTQRYQDLSIFLIVGGDDAPFDGGNDMGNVEAESSHMAYGTERFPFIKSAVSFGRVLYDHQIVFPGDLQDRIHVRWLPHEVHGHNSPGLFRDGRFNLVYVDVQRFTRDIYKDGAETCLQYLRFQSPQRKGLE